jgi:acetyl-CoA carboxylase carboxyltransferase component
MGGKGAIEILMGKEIKAIEDPEKLNEFMNEKEIEYRQQFANPYVAAKYGYLDDVIEPRNTRYRIIKALMSLQTKRLENPPKKHDNLPL